MLRYALPIFLGAFLLFQVQPIIARCILPWFGGTPSVWTTCMLFFQMLLLAGYAWAHLVVVRSRNRTQGMLQAGILVLSAGALGWATLSWGVPLLPSAEWKPADSATPVASIILTLLVSVGLPYLVLATTSPLLQAWFVRTDPGRSPYWLYTLSNAGSLLALITYPFLIEPHLALRTQARIWSIAYLAFAAACLYCAWRLARTADTLEADEEAEADAEEGPPPSWRQRALWVLLPALASVMLLAVTNRMCQEVAVVPFLWVLPLSLYLLSFILCFAGEMWYSRLFYIPILVFTMPAALAWLWRNEQADMRIEAAWYSVVLLLCCMVCHGELVAKKPRPRHLTGFYLAISVGGALGGLLVGIVAPLVFRSFTELPLGLVAALIVGLVAGYRYRELWRPWLRYSVLAAALFCGALLIHTEGDYKRIREGRLPLVMQGARGVLAKSRNFYGLLRVREFSPSDPERHQNVLVHGRTIHGIQFRAAEKRMLPTSYFAPQSGIARAIVGHPRRSEKPGDLRLGVMGLGTGTLAAHAVDGDYVRFYEINPDVIELAGPDGGCFTYVRECEADVEIALGDARISLERELKAGSQRFDVLAMDAFSSDAVPAHLITREAFEVYLQHLRRPGGIIAVNISNKWVDLRPVTFEAARHFGLHAVLVNSEGDDGSAYRAGWVLMSPNAAALQTPELAEVSQPLTTPRRIRLWTDDFYSLFQILL